MGRRLRSHLDLFVGAKVSMAQARQKVQHDQHSLRSVTQFKCVTILELVNGCLERLFKILVQYLLRLSWRMVLSYKDITISYWFAQHNPWNIKYHSQHHQSLQLEVKVPLKLFRRWWLFQNPRLQQPRVREQDSHPSQILSQLRHLKDVTQRGTVSRHHVINKNSFQKKNCAFRNWLYSPPKDCFSFKFWSYRTRRRNVESWVLVT